MKIREQFNLPIKEREKAIKMSVSEYFAHQDCASVSELIESLRSLEDVVCGRPAPVSTKDEILSTNLFYKIAFKFEHKIDSTLNL